MQRYSRVMSSFCAPGEHGRSPVFSEGDFGEMLSLAEELKLTIFVAVTSAGLFGTSDYDAISEKQRIELMLAVRPMMTYVYTQIERFGRDWVH